jgi:hypothetical protein
VESGHSLEATRALAADAPRLASAPVIEGHALRAHRVLGDLQPAFVGFLDGTQASRVVRYDAGMPIVHGTVAAAVRVRRNRRLTTWARGPRVERRLYAPCAYLPPAVCAALEASGAEVVDTTQPDARGERPAAHPFALLERAVHFVQADRERVERALAEDWCRTEGEALCVDGGIQASEVVAGAPCAVGVVKSHRTLYVEGDALRTVLALRRGERSSVFRIAAHRRSPVASWYLRLRDPAGRDPMWGLVRLEARLPDAGTPPAALAERTDAVSRWVLAEAAPLALPDGRYDKMVYGIYDCERFLDAVC